MPALLLNLSWVDVYQEIPLPPCWCLHTGDFLSFLQVVQNKLIPKLEAKFQTSNNKQSEQPLKK